MIANGLHLWFGLPIHGPNYPKGYIGKCRVFLRSKGIHITRKHSMDPQGWSYMLKLLPLEEEDALGSPLPS